MISARLKAIASLIPNESKVIDVGSDHGLLDIYLTKNKKCDCVATDINPHCIKVMLENIEKSKLKNKIIVKQADGLDSISYDDNTYVIIAGMGTIEIIKILKRKKPKHLVVQSNTDLYDLRYELSKYYTIVDEVALFNRGKWYTIIKFELGQKKYSYEELLLGPIIKKSDNLKYKNAYYEKNLYIYNKILWRNFKKKVKYYKIVKTLKKLIINKTLE